MSSILKREGWLMVLLAGVLCLAGPAGADDATTSAPAGEAVVYDTPAAEGISVEQEAQLRGFLAPHLNWSDAGLVEVADPDGGFSMDPEGRFQSMVLARVGADGKLEIRTFTGLEGAMRFLKFEDLAETPPQPPAVAE